MSKQAEEQGGFAGRHGVAADSSLTGACTTETGPAEYRAGVDSLEAGGGADVLAQQYDGPPIGPPDARPIPIGPRGVAIIPPPEPEEE